MYLGRSQSVVIGRARSNTRCLSILPPPVKVVSTGRLSPAPPAIILKCAIRAAGDFIGVVSTVIFEVAYLSLVHTFEVLTDILLGTARGPSGPRVEAKWSRCWLTWRKKERKWLMKTIWKALDHSNIRWNNHVLWEPITTSENLVGQHAVLGKET